MWTNFYHGAAVRTTCEIFAFVSGQCQQSELKTPVMLRTLSASNLQSTVDHYAFTIATAVDESPAKTVFFFFLSSFLSFFLPSFLSFFLSFFNQSFDTCVKPSSKWVELCSLKFWHGCFVSKQSDALSVLIPDAVCNRSGPDFWWPSSTAEVQAANSSKSVRSQKSPFPVYIYIKIMGFWQATFDFSLSKL